MLLSILSAPIERFSEQAVGAGLNAFITWLSARALATDNSS
jgi:hypothetical protein